MPPLEYDILEVLPDGSTVLRASVHRLEAAWRTLYELASHTPNELIAVHQPTREVVAQLNVPPADERARKRLFQIAYTEGLGIERAEALTYRGYHVTTVIGNTSAMVALADLTQHYDLFILGHGAPEQTRREMVEWLKINYPQAKILALNSVHQQLPDADFNVLLNGPETWMPIVARALD